MEAAARGVAAPAEEQGSCSDPKVLAAPVDEAVASSAEELEGPGADTKSPKDHHHDDRTTSPSPTPATSLTIDPAPLPWSL